MRRTCPDACINSINASRNGSGIGGFAIRAAAKDGSAAYAPCANPSRSAAARKSA